MKNDVKSVTSPENEKPKEEHHTVPRYYLNGFMIPNGMQYAWVYNGESSFNPPRAPRNPRKQSTKSITVIRKFYTRPGAVTKEEQEEYENWLAREEDEAKPALSKVRGGELPDRDEKTALAKYICSMIRRVPQARRRMKQRLPQNIDDILLEDVVQNQVAHLDEFAKSLVFEELKARKLAEENLDVTVHLDALKRPMKEAVPFLASMAWVFFEAPRESPFFTSDHPVFYHQNLGLNHPDGELCFPISSSIALRATKGNSGVAFQPANEDIVHSFNQRQMLNADGLICGPIISAKIANEFHTIFLKKRALLGA